MHTHMHRYICTWVDRLFTFYINMLYYCWFCLVLYNVLHASMFYACVKERQNSHQRIQDAIGKCSHFLKSVCGLYSGPHERIVSKLTALFIQKMCLPQKSQCRVCLSHQQPGHFPLTVNPPYCLLRVL